MSDAIQGRAAKTSRYSATVENVKHRDMPPDKRQDTEIVTARLDYADGAMWWVADEGTIQTGDRYHITVTPRAL